MAPDLEGRTCLHWTVGNQSTGCVDALLAHLDAVGNADLINAIDAAGDTALQVIVLGLGLGLGRCCDCDGATVLLPVL